MRISDWSSDVCSSDLKDILDLHARKLLQQQRTVSLPDEVRHLIRSMIASGSPSMAAVAAQLGMSHRSLHRRLNDSGCSYRDLLEDIRLELAHRYLIETQDPVSHAAGVQIGRASCRERVGQYV